MARQRSLVLNRTHRHEPLARGTVRPIFRVERYRTGCPAPVADGDQLELRCVVMTRFVRSRAAVMPKEDPDCLFNDLFGGDRQALATHHPRPQ
jgi:hypothetical protein